MSTPGLCGYADYILTEEFQRALDGLPELAHHHRMVIVCAEPVRRRCHRSFIADALTAHGATLCHLLDRT